jgi:hypothetical protein
MKHKIVIEIPPYYIDTLPATSETGGRWPRFGLVVVTTTSRRDNKDQGPNHLDTVAAIASCGNRT